MKTRHLFTLMHISDLHRSKSDPVTNTELLSGIAIDTEKYSRLEPSIEQPDAIIVSGDLVQGLRLDLASDPWSLPQNYQEELEEQYVEAFEFLAGMADHFFGGDRSKIVIVPGNHDVDWNRAFSAMEPIDSKGEEILQLLEMPDSLYRWSWEKKQLFQITDVELYDSRFEYYAKYFVDFYDGTNLGYELDPLRNWNFFSLDDDKILVCGFNSCYGNDCFNRIGRISYDDIAGCHMAMRQIAKPHSLLMGVWHHNVKGAPLKSDYMDEDEVMLMVDKGFRLGLHGHQHRSDILPYSLYSAEQHTMAVVSAGSLCAGPTALPIGHNREYNIVEINDDYSGARVHVREMSISGIFGSGRLVTLGGSSFADIQWTSTPAIDINNTGRSGGQEVREIEQIEKLMAERRFEEAADEIESLGRPGETYHRRLMTEALFRSENWQRLIDYLDAPQNDDELGKIVQAMMELGAMDKAELLLSKAGSNSQFDGGLINGLLERLEASRRFKR